MLKYGVQRKNINNPTGPNETARVATLHCFSIYIIKTKGQQSGVMDVSGK